jgi:hypothetical protein
MSLPLYLCYSQLAMGLFGLDAFEGDCQKFLKEPVGRFIDILLTMSWVRLRKSIKLERNRIEDLMTSAEGLLKGLPPSNCKTSLAEA